MIQVGANLMGSIGNLLKKIMGGSSSDSQSNGDKRSEMKNSFKVVRVQPTPNPDAFQFIMNGPVIHSGTKTYNNADEGKGDPLAESLFAVYGIENIFFKESFVTITKSKVVGWHTVMEKIGKILEAELVRYEKCDVPDEHTSLADTVLEQFKKEDFVTSTDEQKAKVIEALLDVAIRPALANDGGGLDILGIEGNIVKIHYQGACGSCPSSTTGTLNYIETFLKEALHPDLQVQAN
jgi:Fe-S cluster biogenesis protein NfuA